jgi:transposase
VAHANARVNSHGRRLLVERVLDQGRPVAHVAKELGISRQSAHRWINRFRQAGEAGLVEKSSRPHRSPRRTSPQVEQLVLQLRRTERRGQDEPRARVTTNDWASTTSMPQSTTTADWPTPRSSRTRPDPPAPASWSGPPSSSPATASPCARSSPTTPRTTTRPVTSRPPSPTSERDTCASSRTARGRTARSSGSTAPSKSSGLPAGLHQQRRAHCGTCTLDRLPQHSTPPLSHRRPTPDQPTVMNLPAEYI